MSFLSSVSSLVTGAAGSLAAALTSGLLYKAWAKLSSFARKSCCSVDILSTLQAILHGHRLVPVWIKIPCLFPAIADAAIAGKAFVCIAITTALEWTAGKELTSINMASARAALAVSSASLGTPTPHSWLKICSSCSRRSRIIFNVPSCCTTVRRIEQSLPLMDKSQRCQ